MAHNTNVDIVGAGSAEFADNLDFSQTAGAENPGVIFAPPQELKEDEHNFHHPLEPTSQSLAKFHTTNVPTWIIVLGGGTSLETGAFVQETIDSEFIVIGSRRNTSSFSVDYDVFFAKVNNVGAPLWAKAFGGVAYNERLAVQNTINGEFIITGGTKNFGNGDPDIFLVKTDSVGTPLWAKVIIGTDKDTSASVQETTDDGFIISGYTRSFGAGDYDIFSLKVDSAGTFTWAKVFGGTDDDYGSSTLETTDNGFIIAGCTTNFGARDRDIFLTKVDNEGNLLWSRILGGASDDCISHMQKTADGGFITIGFTASFGAGSTDIFLGKFNSEGILVWAQALGGTGKDSGTSVQETADGGSIITGIIPGLGAVGDKGSISIAKVNNVGNFLWAKAYRERDIGVATCVQETSDGGFIITGAVASPEDGGGDIFLAKVTATGEVSDCSIIQDITALVNVTNITSLLIAQNVNPTIISINPNITDITHSLSVQNISLAETEICSGSNSGPIVANFIPDQTIKTGVATSFQFNANTFNDPDGDSLAYSATLADGIPLPGWITFVPATRTFNFNPTSNNEGSINLKVTAADGYGGIVSDVFSVVAESEIPVVANPIPDQTIVMEKTTLFQFNANTFNDPDGDNLTYSTSLENNSPLPSWITFDVDTRTFTMNPTIGVQKTISIKVTARDSNGGTASDVFNVMVNEASTSDGWKIPVIIVASILGGLCCIASTIVAMLCVRKKSKEVSFDDYQQMGKQFLAKNNEGINNGTQYKRRHSWGRFR